jgi:hypothetical protein
MLFPTSGADATAADVSYKDIVEVLLMLLRCIAEAVVVCY